MDFRERSIIHFNVADFSVAVEQIADSSLKNRALIIGHMGASRAIVHDMSEEAFQAGVRKGMPLRQAARICRGATMLPPRFPLYQRAMHAFLKKVNNYSPLIEHGYGDGHIFLDVTGTHRLFGPPVDIGWRIQKEINSSLRFTPIWALASNKLVAKVASRLVKPVGEYIVSPGEERDFLAPLPISLLPGINTREHDRLHEFNLTTIGQLASFNKQQLMIPFGKKRSDHLYNISRGIDQSQVSRQQQSGLCLDHSFISDTNDQKQVKSAVALLAAQAGQHLRQKKLTARRIGISLMYSDGGKNVRQATRKRPTSNDFILTELALLALQRSWTRRTRLRSCTLHCDLLQKQSRQLTLFDLETRTERKQEQLILAMDTIQKKHGDRAILTGLQQREKQ